MLRGPEEGAVVSVGSVWVALEAGADPAASARALRGAHERFFDGGERVRSGVRSIISASWRRSQRAGVLPEIGAAPVPLFDDALAERRERSGLAATLPVVRDLVGLSTREARHLLIVTDAQGHLLWVEGARELRRAAEGVGLVPGALWNEQAAGTNAMGTALAVDHPVQVFAAEHVRSDVHEWTCAAAPLRDPDTGALLGSIDLTSPASAVHPHSLVLVTAAARALRALLPQLAAPSGPAVKLRALGGDRATVEAGGRELVLSRRHSEIAVLLALHPEGLSAEQLALELFGEHGKPVSVRAELSRLRRLLGPALDTQPYRFATAVQADFLDVRDELDAGRPAAALAAYSGELLASSEGPGISELRRCLDSGVRAAVLSSGDDALLRTWLDSPAGWRDLPALELLLRRRPMDPELAMLGRRAERLRSEHA
jgi:hypothetical protein